MTYDSNIPFNAFANQARQQAQKDLNKTAYRAIIGDEVGNVSLPNEPQFIQVRKLEGVDSDGNNQYGVAYGVLSGHSAVPLELGTPVIVGTGYDGLEMILGIDRAEWINRGKNPRTLNPHDPYNKFIELQYATIAYSAAVSTAQTPTYEAVVYPLWYIGADGTSTIFAGGQFNFASDIPAADSDGNDQQILAGLFINRNNQLESVTSTPKAINDILSWDTDVSEIISNSSARALPIRFYRLYTSQTRLQASDEWGDGRQWIQIPSVRNNYTATVAPTVNDDIDSRYEIGSLWLNNTDTNYYICNDSTAGAAHWERILTSLSGFVSTGIIDGGAITQNVGTPTTIDIAAGSGIIVDKSTTPEDPITTHVDWTAKTAVVFDNTGVFDDSYIAIDSNGDVVQRSVPFTIDETRQYVVLGFVSHPIANSNNVQSISTYGANSIGSIGDGTQDILTFIGGISKYDNPIVYSAATGIYAATLRVAHSAGDILQLGVNYNGNNRHNIHSAAAIDPDVFYYRWINASVVPAGLGSVIVPGTWDDGTGTNLSPPTGSVNPNQWTVQRIFYRAGTAETFIHYGQNVYATKNAALEAIFQGTDTFTIDPELRRTGALLRSFMAVRGGATATDDTGDVVFIEADQFGVGALGVNLTVVQSLQNVYDNSGQPEIIIDSTRSTINIRNATSDTETDLMDFYSNDGLTKYGAIGKNGLSLNAGATVNDIVNSATGIDATSTDTQLATAKAVYDFGGGGGSVTDYTQLKTKNRSGATTTQYHVGWLSMDGWFTSGDDISGLRVAVATQGSIADDADLLVATEGRVTVVAAEAISIGQPIKKYVGVDSGKIGKVVGSTGGDTIGVAMTAAAADGNTFTANLLDNYATVLFGGYTIIDDAAYGIIDHNLIT